MLCPRCENSLPDNDNRCPSCGFDLTTCSWVTIVKVYPPEDIIIESLFKSHGIPFITNRHGLAQMPFSLGPSAEVEIKIPLMASARARTVLEDMEFNHES